MPWPAKITNPAPSTSTQFGGDIMNLIRDLLNGSDIAATDSTMKPQIATETRFYNSKFGILSPNGNNLFILKPVANPVTSEDKIIGIPAITLQEDNLVCEQESQELKNKTIDYNNNTCLNFPTPGEGTGDMLLASAQNVSGAKTFLDTKLLLRNPADTYSAMLKAGAQSADRIFTFPVVTADDDIVTKAATQTVTGKTIDYNSNTCLNFPGATGGEANTYSNAGVGGIGVILTKSGVNLPFKSVKANSTKVAITDGGANNNVLVDVTESALTLDSIGGTLGVAKGGTGATTLQSGEVLKGNGASAISAIAAGSDGDVLTRVAGAVAWQAPSSAPSGMVYPGQSSGGGGIYSEALGGLIAAPLGKGIFSPTGITTGTLTREFVSGAGNYTIITTAATDSSLAEIKNTNFQTERAANTVFEMRFKLGTLTNYRLKFGFTSTTTWPTGSSAETTYLNNASGIALILRRVSGYANDTNYQLIYNGGGASQTSVNTNIAYNNTTQINTFRIIFDNANTRIGWQLNGGAITYYTTNIPAAGTALNLILSMETNGSNSNSWKYNYVYMKSDY